MNITLEDTSSPLQGVKYVKPFSNFFQSTKERLANLDPDSAVHLVGPMFELTAGIDKEKSLQDFDAIYPPSGVSIGPTICSFGLSYNDHNYAIPVGLTPPNMAPHLMDLHLPPIALSESDHDVNVITPQKNTKQLLDAEPKEVTNSMNETTQDMEEDSSQSKSLIRTRGMRSSTNFPKIVTPPTKMTPIVFASVADSTSGLSEPKKALFAAWHAKAAASGGTLLVQQRWKVPEVAQQQGAPQKQLKDQLGFPVPRYCKGLIKAPDVDGEFRCDLDMKVIEVPDDICVSPSKLSDLESTDDEDEDDVSTTSYLSSRRSADKSQQKPAVWSTVRCPCETNMDSKMQQCLKCRLLQHVECMEVVYGKGLCVNENNPIEVTPMETLMDPTTYLCPMCITPPITMTPMLIERIRTSTQQRHSSNTQGPLISLTTNPLMNVTEGARSQPGGAQLLAHATDRARQLGLIGSGGSGSGSSCLRNPNCPDDRIKLSCFGRQTSETTDVNRRIPSPPRASKRKQDLTTTSYDKETNRPSAVSEMDFTAYAQSSPSSAVTCTPTSASNTPLTTPGGPSQLSYHHHIKVYSAEGGDDQSPSNLTNMNSLDVAQSSSPIMTGGGIMGGTTKRKLKKFLLPASPMRKSSGKRTAVLASTLGSAWAKDYKEADINIYSDNLLAFIGQRIIDGRERIQRLPPTCLGRTPLCRVVLFDHNDKGLEASARLGKGEVVTEIRGNLMLLDEYEHYVDPMNEYNRYVMIYHNFGGRAIAINTAHYGNDARFIRRSCIPNCILDHFIVCNKLRVIIRTTQELMPGVELTIPFDFDYRTCRYVLKCACARSRCPVQKWCRKLARHKVMPHLDYGKYIESRLNDLSKTITDDQSPVTTPRGFSADYSPVHSALSSTQKSAVASPSFAASASSPQRFTVSPANKRPTPSACLFTAATTPSVTSPVQLNVSKTSASRKRSCIEPLDSVPSMAEKTPTTNDRESPPPFEPIITTRSQAAKVVALSKERK